MSEAEEVLQPHAICSGEFILRSIIDEQHALELVICLAE
jgi:hypothetical protein